MGEYEQILLKPIKVPWRSPKAPIIYGFCGGFFTRQELILFMEKPDNLNLKVRFDDLHHAMVTAKPPEPPKPDHKRSTKSWLICFSLFAGLAVVIHLLLEQ